MFAAKLESTIKPKTFESLNNGIWYYNFDLNETYRLDFEDNLITTYTYTQVRITGKPTIDKCYNALLKAYVSDEDDKTTLYNLLTSPAKTAEHGQLAELIYEQILVDFGIKEKPTELEVEKRNVLKEIDNYDKSIEVNSFFLNGLLVWLDKSTRVGLMNSLTIEKNSGKEISTLWFGNIKLNINTDAAILMLSALELYALSCYNKTAEHKVNIENFTTKEEVLNYDYTVGYPDKLNFTV